MSNISFFISGFIEWYPVIVYTLKKKRISNFFFGYKIYFSIEQVFKCKKQLEIVVGVICLRDFIFPETIKEIDIAVVAKVSLVYSTPYQVESAHKVLLTKCADAFDILFYQSDHSYTISPISVAEVALLMRTLT